MRCQSVPIGFTASPDDFACYFCMFSVNSLFTSFQVHYHMSVITTSNAIILYLFTGNILVYGFSLFITSYDAIP